MSILLLILASLGSTWTQTISDPLLLLHRRFTTKLDTNYIFQHLLQPPTDECAATTGIYCSLINNITMPQLDEATIKRKSTLQEMVSPILITPLDVGHCDIHGRK